MLTIAEENYLKAIFKLSNGETKTVSTNAISDEMETRAASVTDMIRRLAEKGYVAYEKYRGVKLNPSGMQTAVKVLRKHRLWESFLVDKLQFSWDEVHPIAEQLEHIKSDELIDKLDAFLDYPKFDPHGDPIPSADGKYTLRNQILLSQCEKEFTGTVVGVKEHSKAFLQYLDTIKISLGTKIQIIEKLDYDQSVKAIIDDTTEILLNSSATSKIFLKPNS